MTKPIVTLTVEVYLPDSEDLDYERDIDHNDGIHRQWLEKLIYWAARNNREVSIVPKGAEE